MFINDVGEGTWEEINDGIAGANYGWPSTEGETTAAGITSPLLAYLHGSGTSQGFAIAGAAFYDSITKQYPADYNGDYFYADYVNSWIRKYDVATDTSTLFGSNMTAGSPVDLKVDSSGALYYLGKSPASVYKIAYPQGQTAPVITDQPDDATVNYGTAALFSILFTAPGPVTYQWRKGNADIPGATGSSYLIPAATLNDEGLYSVVVTDAFGSTTSNSARLTVKATIAGRHIFYNGSAFDLNDLAANAADDVAIATDKQPLLPGGTATFANYTSYWRGINGIMIDVQGLRSTPTAGDFVFHVGNSNSPGSWASLATAPTISVRPAAGVNGSDRLTLIWPNNVIEKQWLQIVVAPTATTTNLPTADVFYFGNAIGESGNSEGDARVTSTDELRARLNPHPAFDPVDVTYPYDFNRDTRVSALDQNIARINRTTPEVALNLISVPAALMASGFSGSELPGGAAAARPAAELKLKTTVAPSSDGSVSVLAAARRAAQAAAQPIRRIAAAVDSVFARGEELIPDYARIRRTIAAAEAGMDADWNVFAKRA
jgi:hypothetical protein